MTPPTITRMSDHVFAVEGEEVNWTVLKDGEDLVLIDAGYPGDLAAVLDSLAEVGARLATVAPGSVLAVLITHAHVDHIGSLPSLLGHLGAPRYDIEVLTSEREAAHARREFLEQAGPLDLLPTVLQPRGRRFLRHIVAAGALRRTPVPQARGTEMGVPLDLPGHPVPILTPGHTSGSTSYLVDDVLITGDALITGHGLSGHDGPQRVAPFFEHDPAQAEATLDVIAGIDAAAIVPGHGRPWRGKPADAVSLARARTSGTSRG